MFQQSVLSSSHLKAETKSAPALKREKVDDEEIVLASCCKHVIDLYPIRSQVSSVTCRTLGPYLLSFSCSPASQPLRERSQLKLSRNRNVLNGGNVSLHLAAQSLHILG